MKKANTFLEVLNTDLADLVIKDTMVRWGMNMRIIDLDSSTYAVTNIRGTEQKFHLSAGYIPLAAKQFDNVLYILSIDPNTSICELGSFGSPDYYGDGLGEEVYRPLANFSDTILNETTFATWTPTGAGTAWVGTTVTLGGTTPLTSNLLEKSLAFSKGISYTLTYQGNFSNPSIINTGANDSTLKWKFYNGSGTLIHTYTILFPWDSTGPDGGTETVVFSDDIAKVDIVAERFASGAAGNLIFQPTLLSAITNNAPFRTTAFGYSTSSYVKMELQSEYDVSINILLFEKNNPPRIVNTKFLRDDLSALVIAPDRPGLASSNQYSTASIDEETKLILTTDVILGISLNSISSGGKLKYGTYRYFLTYMTEDFNSTEVIGQSGLCAVFTGTSMSNIKGGLPSQETDKRVALNLTNIDVNFKYLKVYVLYSSGEESLEQQMLELVIPTEITGDTMTFYHTGFEQILEVDIDVVNTNFQAIDSATTGTQNNGYLILGGIREKLTDYTIFKAGALAITTAIVNHSLPLSTSLSTLEMYADYHNIYNYVGLFGAEAYPYRVVFILPGGRLTPPFPVTGKDYSTSPSGAHPANSDGIFRPYHRGDSSTLYDGTYAYVNGVRFDLSAVPSNVKDASVGFFFVRAERNPNLLAQGYLIPSLMVPPISFFDTANTYFNRFQAGNESAYKLVPCLDNWLEAYEFDGVGIYAVDNLTNKLILYMPIVIEHFGTGSADGQPTGDNHATYINNYPTDSWSFISADAIANEPEMITRIARRPGMVCLQVGKAKFTVGGPITPIASGIMSIGLFYDTTGFIQYPSNTSGISKTIDLCEFVPNESFATGSVFSSMVQTRFKDGAVGCGVWLGFNSYFGMKCASLKDSAAGTSNPRGGNYRIPSAYFSAGSEAQRFGYTQLGSVVNGAFLVNVYPAGGVQTLDSIYPNTDSLIYKQVGQRHYWSEGLSTLDVYDGDCYITKTFRKLYQSTYRDPQGPVIRSNINSGMVMSLIQETSYNTYLRNPLRYDSSEYEDRSFFPYQSNGNFDAFRKYRFPESRDCSPGYNPGLGPKSYVPISSLAPAIRTDFFTRLTASARHVPNAFQNGYRNFTGNNFRDYDSSMGRIVGLESFRDQLIIIFEHGVGGITVEARILAGQDVAGPVFSKPGDILPPNMGMYSRQIGCQHPLSIFTSPSAVYAVDADKKKIWQLRDSLKCISDDQIASFLNNNPIVNPRIGYNFKYNEVVFTTDNWTLAFREGLEKFTFPYSFLPTFYASRGADFYSFYPQASVQHFHKHDVDTRLIYGTQQDCYIEFVVRPNGMTNVYDVIEIFSNEVTPSKVEFFTVKDSKRSATIDPAACLQYSHELDVDNFFKQESPITFRDKRYIVQIPKTEVYNGSLDTWGVGGRMRNKFLIVRLTYNTNQALQLMSVLTTFRESKS